MITARNYAAQAEKGLIEYSNRLDDEFHLDKLFIRKVSEGIGQSVHFALPDGGSIFDDDLKGISGMQARLPFPEITIEYYTKPENQKKTTEYASEIVTKRVIYACELSCRDLKKNPFSKKMNLEKLYKNDDEILIFIYSAFYLKSGWVPCLSYWIMPASWDDTSETEEFPVDLQRIDTTDKSKFTGTLGMLCPGLCDELASQVGDDEAFKYLAYDIAGEVRAVLELIEALSCSNIKHEPIEKIDQKKNEKRIKAGKLPIYETRVLTIDPIRSASKSFHQDGNSDRNSPRQHLRRGHIRRLPDKNVWVNSCLVGSAENGRLDKSYRIY